ncbi:MAG: hypothetical protein AAEJ43_11635 [Gammaproteobacteria bacterium]
MNGYSVPPHCNAIARLPGSVSEPPAALIESGAEDVADFLEERDPAHDLLVVHAIDNPESKKDKAFFSRIRVAEPAD